MLEILVQLKEIASSLKNIFKIFQCKEHMEKEGETQFSSIFLVSVDLSMINSEIKTQLY